MRNSRQKDPDELDIELGRFPRKLVWGLTKGIFMLAVAAGVTWGMANLLQAYAHKQAEQAQQAHSTPDESR